MPNTLEDVKSALRITHASDDALLTRLIDSATREFLAFKNGGDLPEDVRAAAYLAAYDAAIAAGATEEAAVTAGNAASDAAVVPSVSIPEDAFNGIVLMVSADYEADPKDRKALRDAAESLWLPYRLGMGV